MVALAPPAAAQPTADLVRISNWTIAAEVRGLGEDQANRVRELWAEFVAGVPAHSACLLASPPAFVAKTDMRPRAAYAPATGTLYVKPGDLDRLVVFHELAHHLDFTCDAAGAIGEEVRAAQGIAADKPWWKHGAPASWPAEYFANAVAVALGESSRHDVRAETVDVVEEWLGRNVAAVQAAPVLTIGEPGPEAPRLS